VPESRWHYQLAGLFHDVIHLTADGGLVLQQQADLLSDVSSPSGVPQLQRSSQQDDLTLNMVMQIFGVNFYLPWLQHRCVSWNPIYHCNNWFRLLFA